jgi:Nif-specific regulatory protein
MRAGAGMFVEASDGLDRPAQAVHYRMGEGITGRVVETSKPVVVPRVSREPAMLNRAARRTDGDDHELSFICVPISLNRRAVGALGIDLRYKAERDFSSLNSSAWWRR